MQNVEMFFKVLEKMEQLESKKNKNKIRKTSILIFKNGTSYNIYFGLASDYLTVTEFYKSIKSTEKEFIAENYKNFFLPNTVIYLGTVNEEELNYILFIFNKKYSVATGPFATTEAKERIVSFHTHPCTNIHASIEVSEENAPMAIKEHIRGTKENYFTLNALNDTERIKSIKSNELFSHQDYTTMLDMLKYHEPENYLKKAYSLSYLAFMEYTSTWKSNHISIEEAESKEFMSATEFLKR